RTAHRQLRPERSLLPDDHREADPRRRGYLVAARLGEDIVRIDGLTLVYEEPVGAPHSLRLLVGDREVEQRAARPEAAVGKTAERDGLRRGEVQHVDRPATPHEAREG